MKLYTKKLNTPLGIMQTLSTDKGICFLEFEDQKDFNKHWDKIIQSNSKEIVSESNKHIILLEEELRNYFESRLQKFQTPIDTEGTAFQKQVWESLTTISFGNLATYNAQANQIQKPKAVRAVANAIGQNRIAILIPCHRVIGSSGSLTGYAGGLWRKEKLLALEQANK